MSDGEPIDIMRGGIGKSFRLIVAGKGFLDFTDLGHQPGGPHYCLLYINDRQYWFDGDGEITVTIYDDAAFLITGDGNQLTGLLKPLPQVSEEDALLLNHMVSKGIVPYRNNPDDPDRTREELEQLGWRFFPYTPYSSHLAMAVYDWTTPDFARLDFFRLFMYTGIPGGPLDKAGIANAVWTSAWPPFTPKNKDYMNAFMMTPARSYLDVLKQLDKCADLLKRLNEAELRLLRAALISMPRTSILEVPILYSGQVALSNLGTHHFAASFLQFPGNKGPVGASMEMPLHEALDSFIQKGKIITTKVVMSFTHKENDAMHSQNGILIKLQPPDDAVVWDQCGYITPLSDGPEKAEYAFPPGTLFKVKDIRYRKIQTKDLLELTMQLTVKEKAVRP